MLEGKFGNTGVGQRGPVEVVGLGLGCGHRGDRQGKGGHARGHLGQVQAHGLGGVRAGRREASGAHCCLDEVEHVVAHLDPVARELTDNTGKFVRDIDYISTEAKQAAEKLFGVQLGSVQSGGAGPTVGAGGVRLGGQPGTYWSQLTRDSAALNVLIVQPSHASDVLGNDVPVSEVVVGLDNAKLLEWNGADFSGDPVQPVYGSTVSQLRPDFVIRTDADPGPDFDPCKDGSDSGACLSQAVTFVRDTYHDGCSFGAEDCVGGINDPYFSKQEYRPAPESRGISGTYTVWAKNAPYQIFSKEFDGTPSDVKVTVGHGYEPGQRGLRVRSGRGDQQTGPRQVRVGCDGGT